MFTIQDVVSVYNGTTGCMCGCRGTSDTVLSNPRRVKLLLNKVQKSPHMRYCNYSNSIYVDHGGRNTVVYLSASAAPPA